jgi:hypothetical protein
MAEAGSALAKVAPRGNTHGYGSGLPAEYGGRLPGVQRATMPHEKPLRCHSAKPPVTVAPLSCQSAPGLAMKTWGATALPGTGMRMVTGLSKTRSCGVNS